MALGEKSYFWDKPEGELTPEELAYYQYSGQDLASVYESMYTTGICPSFAVSNAQDNPEQYIGSSLAVSAGNGLQIVVSPGVAMIKGRPYLASLTIPVAVEAGTITDIILRMDLQGSKPFIAVAAKRRILNGTLVQSLVHDSLVYEIGLATVEVPTASVQITPLMITDQRLNMTLHPTDQKPVAGLMKSIPHVDTLGVWEDWQKLEAYCRSTWTAFMKASTDEWAAFLQASDSGWKGYLAQCGGEWANWKTNASTEWGTIKENTSAEFGSLSGQYSSQISQNQTSFNLWFSSIQGSLSGDVAAELAGKIAKLQTDKADKVHTHTPTEVGARADNWLPTAEETGAAPASHASDTGIHVTPTNKVYTLSHAKSGTVHQLAGLTGYEGLVSCRFKASGDFNEGDSCTVDGVSYQVRLTNGGEAADGLFVSGALVFLTIDPSGKQVCFPSGGGGGSGVGGNLSAADKLPGASADPQASTGKSVSASMAASSTGALLKRFDMGKITLLGRYSIAMRLKSSYKSAATANLLKIEAVRTRGGTDTVLQAGYLRECDLYTTDDYCTFALCAELMGGIQIGDTLSVQFKSAGNTHAVTWKFDYVCASLAGATIFTI